MNKLLWTKTQNAFKGVLGTLMLLCLSVFSAQASHLSAADISVRYIGSVPGDNRCVPIFTYQVTIDVYKICEPGGTSLPTGSTSYTINSPSGCYVGNINRNAQLENRIDTFDQLCTYTKNLNACRLPNQDGPNAQPGIIRHRFIDTVSLPQACEDWTFFWSSNARNAGVNNLQNPGSQDLYVSCKLNNVARPMGSTPKFTIDPTPFLCVNKPSIFLNGPIDYDGDSIAIVPTVAKGGAGAPINYVAPYTFQNPVNSPASYPYYIDPLTGTVRFIAPAAGKFVLAFRMFKYDRLTGQEIGYVDRDVQTVVFPCTGDVPVISDPPISITGGTLIQSGAQGNIVTICPGDELQFTVNASSTTPTALLSIDDTLGSRIGSFSLSGSGTNVTGTFTYRPQAGAEGDYTKIFTVSDTSCAQSGQIIVQKNYVAVLIRVPTGIEAGPDGDYCQGDTANPYQINVTSPAATTYSWSVLEGGDKVSSLSCTDCPNPKARPDSTTAYVVTAVRSPYLCKNVDTITVRVNRIKTIPDDEIVLCRPGFINLDAEIFGRPNFSNVSCTIQDTLVECVTPDSARVGFCVESTGGAVTQTPFRTANASSRLQMIYLKEEMKGGGMTTGTIRSLSFFVTSAPSATEMRNVKLALSCTPLSFYTSSQFITNTVEVYSDTLLPALVPGWNTIAFKKPYNWDTTQNLLVDFCFTNSGLTAGAVSTDIRYSATTNNTVAQRASNNENTCLIPGIPTLSKNRPNIRFQYCRPDSKPFKVTWTPGLYLVDSDVKAATGYIPKSIKYYVQTRGYNNCIVRDSIDITVAVDTVFTTPTDSLICPGDVAILQASPRAYYKWYQGSEFARATTLDCDTCARVIARPTENTDYYLLGFNYVGTKVVAVCTDTFKATVRLKERANVQLTPKDVTIRYGESVPLYANGANIYYWTPGSGLNGLVGPTVVASPKTTTTYVVTGINTNGCQDSDTGIVRVDPSTTIFLPTAFTPNGDNVNDYFNPGNLTTQRIVEFRIFNRWGEQMFSSNTNAPGWDGSLNGVAQPSGTYTYILRTTLPDGGIQTYKGDFTLIR
ncbi:MAG: gliding motility-associated C-terminal domain-containing protein [Sphingobacteriales bacterium]|nr:MAG: gliding motility-associated C-terminal domain-containing protein [Sphingobacteriales bacterium]